MKHVYVVMVHPEYAMPKVSSEAYDSLEKAQRFIEVRGDMPEKINAFSYKGRTYGYTIHELVLR